MGANRYACSLKNKRANLFCNTIIPASGKLFLNPEFLVLYFKKVDF